MRGKKKQQQKNRQHLKPWLILPFLGEAVHLFFVLQLHVQLVVEATTAVATKNTENNPIGFKSLSKVYL